jgi:hypothetical protein
MHAESPASWIESINQTVGNNSKATIYALLQESVTFNFWNSALSCWAAWPFCNNVLESSDVGAENAKRDAKAEKAKKAIAIIESRVEKIQSFV